MRQSKHLFQHCRMGAACLASVLVGMLFFQPTFGLAAQAAYEALPVLSASRILPPEILSGLNHRVRERVKSDGIVNIYKLK